MSETGGAAVGLLSYETLVHAVAGAMGSVTAMTVFFPLDTARIRLQVDENRKSKSTPVILAEIAKEEGIMSLYRGWFPVISSLCCSNFVYFYTFNCLKRMMVTDKRQSRPSKDLVMGFISGAVNVLLTTPMWVVKHSAKSCREQNFRNEELHIRPPLQWHFWSVRRALKNDTLDNHSSNEARYKDCTLEQWEKVMSSDVSRLPVFRMMGASGDFISRDLSSLVPLPNAIATSATYPLQDRPGYSE
ncbi:hypothetical protein NFI96_021833, partial [Prochilodus magdalenae]